MKICLIDVDGHNFPNLPQRLFLTALAEAMVNANLPEWHTVTIVNMAQFHKAVAM